MSAVIHDDVAIVCDHIVHNLFAIQALNDGYINHTTVAPPTAADLTDAFDRQIQEAASRSRH